MIQMKSKLTETPLTLSPVCLFKASVNADQTRTKRQHCIICECERTLRFLPLILPVIHSRWELAAMTTNSNISRPIFSSHG